MKRTLALILALIMTAATFAVFSAVSVGADTIEYIYKENYNNRKTIPPQKDAMGLRALHGYKNGEVLEDGAYKVTNVEKTQTSAQTFLDFLIRSCEHTPEIKETFTVRMDIKPVGATWNRSNPDDFFWFMKESSGEGDVASEKHQYFFTTEGKIGLRSDSGDAVTAEPMSTESFTTFEVAFNMTGNVFTSIDAYVNGVKLGTKTFEDANLTSINIIRMFVSYTWDQGMILDGFSFVKGATSTYGTAIPDSPAEIITEIAPAPVVPEEDKTERKYYFHEDFNDKETVNTDVEKAKESNGFWLCNDGGTDDNWALNEGVLEMRGAGYIDLQMHTVSKYRVKEDFVLSAKFLPQQTGINGWFLEYVRRDSQGIASPGIVHFVDGKIFVGEKDCGIMTVNEWLLIEVAFHYDDNEDWFDSYTVMLNGEEVAEGTFDVETVQLTLIKHFRMFRWMSSYNFAVDDINLVQGSDSILYALAYDAEPTVPDNGGESEEDGEQSEDEADKPKKDTAKKDTETTEAPADQTAPAEEKGCGSFVSGSAVAMVAVIGACGAVALRKRED